MDLGIRNLSPARKDGHVLGKISSGIHPPASPITVPSSCHSLWTARTSHRLGLGITVRLSPSTRERLLVTTGIGWMRWRQQVQSIEPAICNHWYVVACRSCYDIDTTCHHILAPLGWCSHVVAAAPIYRCCCYDMTTHSADTMTMLS